MNTSVNYDGLPKLITRARYGGERIVVELHGKAIAAIISYADLKRFEAIEDAIDSALLQKAVVESNGESLTLAEVLARRGLAIADLDE